MSETSAGRRDRRRPWGPIAFAILFLGVGGGLGWSGSVLLAKPEPLPSEVRYSVVEASEGIVERSIRLNAQAHWTAEAVLANRAEGTITKVHLRGASTVRPGSALFDVDLVPVRVATGSVPMFRTLELGIRGDDVRQLQQLLRDVGVRETAPTGTFDWLTRQQVRQWQRSVGLSPAGMVPVGELVFVPRLPATVALGAEFVVGAVVTPGSPSGSGGIRVLAASPRFTIVLPELQASLVEPGQRVRLTRGNKSWDAVVKRVGTPSNDRGAVATLTPLGGGNSICGRDCPAIPTTGDGAIPAVIQLVPRTRGVIVPSAALRVDDSGAASVAADDGEQLPVQVLAAAGGRAVVDGLRVGQPIRVPNT